MRKTYAMVQVAMALLEDPQGKHWGYQLSKSSGVRSGVLYPILTRMLDSGWLTDGWEEQVDTKKKRPPRRYYEITELGLRELGALQQQAQTERRFAGIASSQVRFA